MAKPTTDPTWATDAAYDADAEPNKIEPPTVLREEGWERGEEPGAQHANYILGAHGAHIDYIHSILEADDAHAIPDVDRALVIHGSIFSPVRLGGTPPLPAFNGSGAWEITDDDQGLWAPLNRIVPFGAQIAGVDLLMSASTKSAPGTFGFYLVPVDFDSPDWGDGGGNEVTLATDTTSGTGAQVLAANASLLVSPDEAIFVRYTPGTITAGIDQIAALRIRFRDPGPRNF